MASLGVSCDTSQSGLSGGHLEPRMHLLPTRITDHSNRLSGARLQFSVSRPPHRLRTCPSRAAGLPRNDLRECLRPRPCVIAAIICSWCSACTGPTSMDLIRSKTLKKLCYFVDPSLILSPSTGIDSRTSNRPGKSSTAELSPWFFTF